MKRSNIHFRTIFATSFFFVLCLSLFSSPQKVVASYPKGAFVGTWDVAIDGAYVVSGDQRDDIPYCTGAFDNRYNCGSTGCSYYDYAEECPDSNSSSYCKSVIYEYILSSNDTSTPYDYRQTSGNIYSCSGADIITSCTSAPNACGQTTTGTSVNGVCDAQTPSTNLYGNSCQSAPNACGQRNWGNYDCNDTCNAQTPSNSSCTQPPNPTSGLWAGPSSCGTGQINVSWNSSSGADSYQLYRGPEGIMVYNGSGTSFSDSNLSPGRYAYYAVFASNSAGTSGDSGARPGTNAPADCDVTTNCQSSPNSCGQTSWGTSLNGGACSAQTPSNPWNYGNWCQSNQNACGQTNSGTIDCNGYCNAQPPSTPWNYGNWCQSAPNSSGQRNSGTVQCDGSCSAVTPADSLQPPSTPGGFWAGPSSLGTGQINLSWNWVSGADYYTVYRNGQWLYQGSNTYVSDYGLSAGQSYTYSLTASNSAGTSGTAWAQANAPNNPVYPPSTPGGFWAGGSSCGTKQINLSWNWVSGADYYTVSRNGQQIFSGGITTISDYNLNEGQTYSYTVTASNSAGTSPQSWTQTSAPPACLTAPSTPGGFWAGASSCGTGQVNLSWNWVNGTDSYTVSRNGQQIYSGGNTYVSDYGLSQGQSYSYTVTASNSAGTSFPASTNTNAPDACGSQPNTPAGFWAGPSSPGTRQINLSWDWNGADYYTVYRNGSQIYQGGSTAISDYNLNEGQLYTYSVTASNSYGTSGSAWTQATAPPAPVSGCSATTINNCSPSNQGDGGSSGSCSGGATGNCSYTCNNGTWVQNWNNCTVPPGQISIYANSTGGSLTITLPNTSFTETYSLSGGNAGDTNCRLLDYNQNPITGYTPCTGSINGNTPNSAGTYAYYIEANRPSTNQTIVSNQFTVTVTALSGCQSTNISNCTLSSQGDGGSSGSCASGSSGSCNYSCSNGTWNNSWNTCTPDLLCASAPGLPSSFSSHYCNTFNNALENAAGSNLSGSFTISASAVVCNNESDLPNWEGNHSISANTASDYVASHPNCHLAQGWTFQWGPLNVYQAGTVGLDNTGAAGYPWNETSQTNSSGVTTVQVPIVDSLPFVWFREEWRNGYVPFTGILGQNGFPYANDISAEMWCANDVIFYDNVEGFIGSPGGTYYCVAFNALSGGSLSVTANNAGPLTLPNTAFTENYNLTGGNSSDTNCRLLDNNQSPLTSYSSCSGSINYNTPNAASTYGYYVQANKPSTGGTVVSNRFTVTVNAASASISVTATNPSPLTLPNTSFTENYTLTGGNSSNTNCRLLDYNQSPITSYTPCSGMLNYNTPASPGGYAYYVQASKPLTGETVVSNQFTVTVSSSGGSCGNGANNPPACNACTPPLVWNGSACVSGGGGGCSGTTINNCGLPAQSGGSAGSCSGSTSGTCNYTCSNGTWTQNWNNCVAALTPACPILTVNKTDINAGDSVTLTWSCINVSSCTALTNPDGFSTGGSINSSDSAKPTIPSGTVTYGMTCDGTPFYFPNVTVVSPSAKITASPTKVISGGSSTISWTLTSVSGCSITKNGALPAWRTGINTSGSAVETNITSTNTYVISCTVNGSTVTDTVVVVVPPVFHEF